MVTPFEMLTILEDAIAYAPKWWTFDRTAVTFKAPEVLGERGRPVGVDPNDPEGRIDYRFTKVQCKRMRQVILAAAHEDMEGSES